jgi:hypothetical protein
VQLDQSVDGLGAAIAGTAGVEVGEERAPPLLERWAEAVDLGIGQVGNEASTFSGDPALESFDLTEPALVLGLGDACGEVVADLDESVTLSGIRPEDRAADTSLSELHLSSRCVRFFVSARRSSAAGEIGEGGHAELDGRGPPPEGGVDLGELLLGAGEADPEAFDLAKPAMAIGFGDTRVELSRISSSRGRCAGSARRSAHLTPR